MTGLLDAEDLPGPPKGIKDSILHHIQTIETHFVPLLIGSNLTCSYKLGDMHFSYEEIVAYKKFSQLQNMIRDSPTGLMVDIKNKRGHNILAHVWIRPSEEELRDYPRQHVHHSITKRFPEAKWLEEERKLLAEHRTHFILIPLRRNHPYLFWADLYINIPVEHQYLTYRRKSSKKNDRMCTLAKARTGKYDPITGLIARLNFLIGNNR